MVLCRISNIKEIFRNEVVVIISSGISVSRVSRIENEMMLN